MKILTTFQGAQKIQLNFRLQHPKNQLLSFTTPCPLCHGRILEIFQGAQKMLLNFCQRPTPSKKADAFTVLVGNYHSVLLALLS